MDSAAYSDHGCFMTIKYFPNIICKLFAPSLFPVPWPSDRCCLRLPPSAYERKTSSRFTGRCAVPPSITPPLHNCLPVSILRELLWAVSGDWCLDQSNSTEIFFQDGAGVTLEAEERGNAVRGSLFVVAFVAGVLPFIVKACSLILQPAWHLVAESAAKQPPGDRGWACLIMSADKLLISTRCGISANGVEVFWMDWSQLRQKLFKGCYFISPWLTSV